MSPTPGFSVAGKLGWARGVLSEVLTTFAQKGELLDQSQLDNFKSLHKEYSATQRRLQKALGFWSVRDPELIDHVEKCGQLRDDIEAAWEESIRANIRGKVAAGDMNDNAQVELGSPVTMNTETPKPRASDAPPVNPTRPSPGSISSIPSISTVTSLDPSSRPSPTVKPWEAPAPSLDTSLQLPGPAVPLVNPTRPNPSNMSSTASVSSLDPSSRSSSTVKPRESPAPSLNTSQLSGLDTRQLNQAIQMLRAMEGAGPSSKYLGQKPPRRRSSAVPESYLQSGCQIISGYADCPTMNTGSGTGNSGATKQWFINGVPVDPPSSCSDDFFSSNPFA
ncbi:hypothetical protein BV22DRAFT_1126686 [Leucogyrophana mollusca]|uniref:Uncharacterized protein n=1 Tax=Leucogyrophana mollusca TaxID=85980 RepID=A0ACB8BRS6_9AGAM|nr:hypothetical protein BV22DRAFT_1126686 [Leucogyrophana mollusca]